MIVAGREAFEISRIRWEGIDFTNITNSGNHENYPNRSPVLPPQPD
jgi:hypothetical protein